MDVRREHFHLMILYDFKCGLKPDESFDRFQQTFMNECPFEATTYRRHYKFKRGRLTSGDEERSGHPSTAVTENAAVKI